MRSLYKAAYDLTPPVPADPAATTAKAEQIAAGTLVALNALARLLTALMLLGIRRPGPGLWWSAVCATLAPGRGLQPDPAAPRPGRDRRAGRGRRRRPGDCSSSPWSSCCCTAPSISARPALLYALVPLFLLWANVDESFLIGLFVLAAAAVGRVGPEPRAKDEPSAPGVTASLVVLAACAVGLPGRTRRSPGLSRAAARSAARALPAVGGRRRHRRPALLLRQRA